MFIYRTEIKYITIYVTVTDTILDLLGVSKHRHRLLMN